MRLDVDALNQLNTLRVGQPQVGATGLGKPAGDAAGGGQVNFKDVLMKNLNEVNQLQEDADKSLQDFVSGKSQNMGEVISASQKASMAFSMLTQIRNKLQDAYDEVKNLRV
jgi:flagellar hook-basal body complex protein FliE